MNNLPIKRLNEVLNFDNYFPAQISVADAQNLALSVEDKIVEPKIVEAPSHTQGAISAGNVYTLSNPNNDFYYNDLINLDIRDILVLDGNGRTFSQTDNLPSTLSKNTLLKNELGQPAYPEAIPRDIKPGQTLFAPEPAQIIALYYRLVDQISDNLSINELNLAVNLHGYVVDSDNSSNAIINGLFTNVISLNDYYVPLFDNLYRTCINDDVLTQVRASYDALYQTPEELTIQASASASDQLRISSLRQARGFIHGLTWLMFTTALNNIFSSIRSFFLSSWIAKIVDVLTPHSQTIFDNRDPKLQQSIDDLSRLREQINNWLEELLIARRVMLSSHNRYRTLHSPDGCITFFEAHRYVNVRAGEIYFEAKHLITTANLLMFSGYLDQFTWSIVEPKKTTTHKLSEEWLSQNYIFSMLAVCQDMADDINKNASVKKAFEQTVLRKHRHYYPPSSLVTMLDDK